MFCKLMRSAGVLFTLLFLLVAVNVIPQPQQMQNQTVTTQKSNKKKNNNNKNNNQSNKKSDSNKSASGTNLSDLLKEVLDSDEATSETEQEDAIEYKFRNDKYLTQHFEKHGEEFDGAYKTKEEYEKGASKVANDPNALHKYEKEDGDDIYYLEDTNEFVVVSKDGYLRTYFKPSAGKKYFDRQ